MSLFAEICVPPDFICDNTDDCGNLYDESSCEGYLPICTFEEGMECDWTQDSVEDDIGMSLPIMIITSECT